MTELESWVERVLKFPEIVQAESSNACNASCIMCPVTTHMTRPKVHMDRDIFRKIVDDCIGKPVHDFHLHQNGEPLLIGPYEFVQRLKYAKEKLNPQGTRVGFFTNASLLYPQLAREILEQAPPEFIIFSFDGGDKESYEKVRIGLNFEQTVRNIKYFSRTRASMGLKGKVFCAVQFVPLKVNEHRIEEFRALFNDCELDNVGTVGMTNYSGAINADPIRHTHQHPMGDKTNPCWRIFTSLIVQSDGQVSLCCMEHDGKVIMGDVRKNTIEEIWKGPMFQHYRDMHIQRRQAELEVCKGCDYMSYFDTPGWYFGR